MIKIKYGGLEFFCDSAAEAAEIAKLISASPNQSQPHETTQNKVAGTLFGNFTTAPDEVDKALLDFGKLPDAPVSSDSLASALGLKSVHGLGPRLAGLSKKIADAYGYQIDFFLNKSAIVGRPTIWQLDRGRYQEAMKAVKN